MQFFIEIDILNFNEIVNSIGIELKIVLLASWTVDKNLQQKEEFGMIDDFPVEEFLHDCQIGVELH